MLDTKDIEMQLMHALLANPRGLKRKLVDIESLIRDALRGYDSLIRAAGGDTSSSDRSVRKGIGTFRTKLKRGERAFPTRRAIDGRSELDSKAKAETPRREVTIGERKTSAFRPQCTVIA
ncbi:hypothetical protein Q2941_28780 [Bradyrhizobium sp. UFLA05-153]